MARHLGDFLCISASARRIVQFDPVQISNRSRFQQLRQSFNDVVLLNQCFQDLSAQNSPEPRIHEAVAAMTTELAITTMPTTAIQPHLHQRSHWRPVPHCPYRRLKELTPTATGSICPTPMRKRFGRPM